MTLPAHLGYFGLALLVGGESLGLFLPGETAILASGVLARDGRLSLALVLIVAAASAIAGDNIGYALGRRGARGLLLIKRGPLLDERVRVAHQGERFFARHGARAVFLARWVVVARVTAPWLAGGSRMPFRTFFLWNALGGITWSATVALAGYALGTAASLIFGTTTVILVVVLLTLALGEWRRRRRARRRLANVCD